MYRCLSTCVSVSHCKVWCPWRPDEALHPLELQFQVLVSCRVGAGDLTQVLCKGSWCSHCWATPPTPKYPLLLFSAPGTNQVSFQKGNFIFSNPLG